MKKFGLKTVSFDIDDEQSFPVPDEHFDAIIALATIEHVINVDHLINEIRRMLIDDGYLYISTPNYSGILYLLPFLISGETFHNPLKEESSYEFYAHVRYFTYNTLLKYICNFGFHPEAVYLGIPEASSHYKELYSKSKSKAMAFKYIMKTIYTYFSPRWASEPVICFKKSTQKENTHPKIRKVVL